MASKGGFIEVDDEQLQAFAADITRFGRRVPAGAKEVALQWGERLLDEVRRNASGRPGPEVRTGEYRASIQLRAEEFGGLLQGFKVSVFSSHPAARRLEYGFIGADTLGRHYHHPPFPHFGPALERLGPQMQADMAAAVPRWWRGQ